MTFDRVCILGVGLLGGSLALALRNVAKGCTIVGYGHRRQTLQAALERRIIDEAYDEPAAAVRNADLVVLCTPVGTFGDLIRTIGPALADAAIVTDVGSTKRSVVRASRDLPNPRRFVGSHPMAGSEKRGVEFADGNLFQGATCILTPTADTDRAAVDRLDALWRSVGMTTLKMAPDEHDARVGLASHLPHAVAAALMLLQDERMLAVSGKGLADTTRIAAGDAGVWRDIFMDNADNLIAGIAGMKRQLDELERRVAQGDAEGVYAWLHDAANRRSEFGTRRGSFGARSGFAGG